jgi:hypothetical protein
VSTIFNPRKIKKLYADFQRLFLGMMQIFGGYFGVVMQIFGGYFG